MNIQDLRSLLLPLKVGRQVFAVFYVPIISKDLLSIIFFRLTLKFMKKMQLFVSKLFKYENDHDDKVH